MPARFVRAISHWLQQRWRLTADEAKALFVSGERDTIRRMIPGAQPTAHASA